MRVELGRLADGQDDLGIHQSGEPFATFNSQLVAPWRKPDNAIPAGIVCVCGAGGTGGKVLHRHFGPHHRKALRVEHVARQIGGVHLCASRAPADQYQSYRKDKQPYTLRETHLSPPHTTCADLPREPSKARDPTGKC